MKVRMISTNPRWIRPPPTVRSPEHDDGRICKRHLLDSVEEHDHGVGAKETPEHQVHSLLSGTKETCPGGAEIWGWWMEGWRDIRAVGASDEQVGVGDWRGGRGGFGGDGLIFKKKRRKTAWKWRSRQMDGREGEMDGWMDRCFIHYGFYFPIHKEPTNWCDQFFLRL